MSNAQKDPGLIGPLTGSLGLGYMLGSILAGVVIMQVQSYYTKFPNDRSWIKWMVGVLLALEIIFTIFTLINVWVLIVTGWGDIPKLEDQTQDWTFKIFVPLNGLIASIVQTFFASRIFKLTRMRWLRMILATTIISGFVLVVVFGVVFTARPDIVFVEESYKPSKFTTIWLIAATVCNVLIAISTITILVRAATMSRFTETSTLLSLLIRLSIETGLVTTVGTIVELILAQLPYPHNNYHFILFLVVGKLYANALLATLNSRTHFYSGTSDSMGATAARNRPTLFDDEYPESATVMAHLRRLNSGERHNRHESDPTAISPFLDNSQKNVNLSYSPGERIPRDPTTISPFLDDSQRGFGISYTLDEERSPPVTGHVQNNIPTVSPGASTDISVGNVLVEVRRLRVQVNALEAQRIREHLPPPAYHESDSESLA